MNWLTDWCRMTVRESEKNRGRRDLGFTRVSAPRTAVLFSHLSMNVNDRDYQNVLCFVSKTQKLMLNVFHEIIEVRHRSKQKEINFLLHENFALVFQCLGVFKVPSHRNNSWRGSVHSQYQPVRETETYTKNNIFPRHLTEGMKNINVVDDPGKPSNRKKMLKLAASTACTVTVWIFLPALTHVTQSAVLLLVALSNSTAFCSTTAYSRIQQHKHRISDSRPMAYFSIQRHKYRIPHLCTVRTPSLMCVPRWRRCLGGQDLDPFRSEHDEAGRVLKCRTMSRKG